MSTAKLSRLSLWRLRGLSEHDRQDVISAATLKALEAGADPAAELDDKHVKVSAQSLRDADNAANGKPSRYGRRIGKRGMRRDESEDAAGNVSDSPAPFDMFLAQLTPSERAAIRSAPDRGRVLCMPIAVEQSIREKVADVAPAGFGETAIPAQGAATIEPVERAPTAIDFLLGGRVLKEVNHCEQCERGCWRCAPWHFRPPRDISTICEIVRTDKSVQDAETLTRWRKLFIANGDGETSPIPGFLFQFPLVVDGHAIPDSILAAYVPRRDTMSAVHG